LAIAGEGPRAGIVGSFEALLISPGEELLPRWALSGFEINSDGI
jgi:hypothetical protein